MADSIFVGRVQCHADFLSPAEDCRKAPMGALVARIAGRAAWRVRPQMREGMKAQVETAAKWGAAHMVMQPGG